MWSLEIRTIIIINTAKIYYVSGTHWQLLVFQRKLCLCSRVAAHKQQSPEFMGIFFFYEVEVVESQGNTFFLTFLNLTSKH